MSDRLSELIRAELDLPDDAGHKAVVELFGAIHAAIEEAEAAGFDDTVNTLNKLKKRVTARILPEKVESFDSDLTVSMLATGLEIDKINTARSALYHKAQGLMIQAIEQGMNQSDVARILGVDRATVRNSTTKTVVEEVEGGKRTVRRTPLTYDEYLRGDEPAPLATWDSLGVAFNDVKD